MDPFIPKEMVFRTLEDEYARQMDVTTVYDEESGKMMGIIVPFRGDNRLLITVINDEMGFVISTLAKGLMPNDDAVNASLSKINELNSNFKRGCFTSKKEHGITFDTFLHCAPGGMVDTTSLFNEVKLGPQMFEIYIDEIMKIVKENVRTDEYVIQE